MKILTFKIALGAIFALSVNSAFADTYNHHFWNGTPFDVRVDAKVWGWCPNIPLFTLKPGQYVKKGKNCVIDSVGATITEKQLGGVQSATVGYTQESRVKALPYDHRYHLSGGKWVILGPFFGEYFGKKPNSLTGQYPNVYIVSRWEENYAF